MIELDQLVVVESLFALFLPFPTALTIFFLQYIINVWYRICFTMSPPLCIFVAWLFILYISFSPKFVLNYSVVPKRLGFFLSFFLSLFKFFSPYVLVSIFQFSAFVFSPSATDSVPPKISSTVDSGYKSRIQPQLIYNMVLICLPIVE